MSVTPAVSVLLVNYNTTVLTQRCIDSLRAQEVHGPHGTEGVEIIVVDNASRPEERRALAGLEAVVLYNADNRGYGAALNQALSYAHGEFILFSNADTWYFPGALQALLDGFGHLPRCGAVGPRLWWDTEREFLLPPGDPVTLLGHLRDGMRQAWPCWWCGWRQRWLLRALQYWQTQRPLPQPMLSGACILTRRDVLAVCGGFDERFHLYYEDTDWCRRVRHRGYQLYYVPCAEVTHLYNQSARQETITSQLAGTGSTAHYFRKHYGTLLWRAVSWATDKLSTRSHHNEAAEGYTDLGACVDPPRFPPPQTPISGAYLFLLSPQPSCIPAIGRLLPAPAPVLSSQVWEQLAEGSFYAQLLSLPSLQLLGKWCWRKVVPSRQLICEV